MPVSKLSLKKIALSLITVIYYNRENDMRKITNYILSGLIIIILGFMAYFGLAGVLALPVPDFVANFAVFFAIFDVFSLETIVLTLPLLIGSLYAINTFSQKNLCLIFLILEIIFLVIIFLYGFRII